MIEQRKGLGGGWCRVFHNYQKYLLSNKNDWKRESLHGREAGMKLDLRVGSCKCAFSLRKAARAGGGGR